MARFDAKPLNPSKLNRAVQRNPAIFGIPFILLMVAASYGMSTFTQTRYDLHDHKVKQLSKAQELGLNKQRKKFDIREEYFLTSRRRLGAKKNTKTERSTRMGRPSNRASTEALKPQKILALTLALTIPVS
ncbi:Cytochrome c oxidase assembly protein mitochondrial [Lentinula edodes]|uniref:Cytochrome c oxidase assembly protein COX16, mitochondrial n=1 Tax=Lentinula edodes TaxID=5353 RepID=A0A1Q3EIU9_LENED|nr:Cytochrome c oxidase assembly protein mitochondrial [Lentinula edodes]